MVSLIPKSPCDGLLPVTVGTSQLSEVTYGAMTSVACLSGQTKLVSAALKQAQGITFPAPNRSTKTVASRAIWIAQDTAMICAETAPHIAGAVMTDQSDGWAVVRLSGPQSTDILARLSPVDLRKAVFKSNHTARTLLGHMTVSITRIDGQSFEIMTFRSMAQTLVHELTTAMKGVAARG